MHNFNLVSMQEKHIPFLTELLNIQGIADALQMPHTSLATWQKAFSAWQGDSDEENFIIQDSDTPIGWLSLNGLSTGDTVWIKMLVIHPNYQKHGAGIFAIRSAEQELISKGFSEVRINTTEENIPAQRCYENQGFHCINCFEGHSEFGTKRCSFTYVKSLKPLQIGN
jgi:ribosomal protein S18 acetylase RimI-like enzyme